jgi:hypothetical protein
MFNFHAIFQNQPGNLFDEVILQAELGGYIKAGFKRTGLEPAPYSSSRNTQSYHLQIIFLVFLQENNLPAAMQNPFLSFTWLFHSARVCHSGRLGKTTIFN